MFKKIAVPTSALAGIAVAFAVTMAWADEQFDVAAAKGEVTVTAKGHWHVNKDYPWKATVGDKVFDKSKFNFTETSAKLSGVPAGKAQLKGAVCDGPQCMPFTKEVTIN